MKYSEKIQNAINKVDENCRIAIDEYNEYRKTQGFAKVTSVDGDSLYEIIDNVAKDDIILKTQLLKHYDLYHYEAHGEKDE